MIVSDRHGCVDVKSEKKRLFEWLQADLNNIEWQHSIIQRIADQLFLRAVNHFTEEYILKTGYPRQGSK